MYILQSSCSTIVVERVLMANVKKRHRRAQYDGLIQPIINAVNNANIDLFFIKNISTKLFSNSRSVLVSHRRWQLGFVLFLSLRTRTIKGGKYKDLRSTQTCQFKISTQYEDNDRFFEAIFQQTGLKSTKSWVHAGSLVTACCSVKGDVTLHTQTEGYTLTMHR